MLFFPPTYAALHDMEERLINGVANIRKGFSTADEAEQKSFLHILDKVSKNFVKGLKNRKLLALFYTTSIDSLSMIESIDNEVNKKRMLNLVTIEFSGRAARFHGNKSDYKILISNFKTTFSKVYYDSVDVDKILSYYRQEEKDMAKCLEQRKELLDKQIDVDSKAEKEKIDNQIHRNARDCARIWKRHEDTDEDLNAKNIRIENYIHAYKESANTMIEDVNANINYAEEELSNQRARQAVMEKRDEAEKEVYGDSADYLKDNPLVTKQIFVHPKLSREQMEQLKQVFTEISNSSNSEIMEEISSAKKDIKSTVASKEDVKVMGEDVKAHTASKEDVYRAADKSGLATKSDIEDLKNTLASKEDLWDSEKRIKNHIDIRVNEIQARIQSLEGMSDEDLIKEYTKVVTQQLKEQAKVEQKPASNPVTSNQVASYTPTQTLPEEAVVSGRNIPLSTRVQSAIKSKDYIGAYANIRATIDGYFRYVKGIELTDNHRLYPLALNEKGESSKPAFYRQVFGTSDGDSISKIWTNCSKVDHVSISTQMKFEKESAVESELKSYVQTLNNLGVKIPSDIVPGVKQLVEHILKELRQHFTKRDGWVANLCNISKNLQNSLAFLKSKGCSVDGYLSTLRSIKSLMNDAEKAKNKVLMSIE